jgi:branched-chain amino acid transport system ATP-binding protein
MMLEVTSIAVRFGKIHAVRDVSLTVHDGEVLTLIGPNGAGKSTTVRAIAGLVRPQSGSVQVSGVEIMGLSPLDVVSNGVALVPQGRQLFGSMTVRENIELGAFHRRRAGDIANDLDRWMAVFPTLVSKLSARASTLSGGQQQAVSLVRGLMSRPKILMLDEPSIGISPAVVNQMRDELKNLVRDTGLSILLVEQNISFGLAMADRVLILTQGRDTHVAAPEELRDPDVLAHYFFPVGATKLDAAPTDGANS